MVFLERSFSGYQGRLRAGFLLAYGHYASSLRFTVAVEKAAISQFVIPLQTICLFSWVAFEAYSLSLMFEFYYIVL